MRPLWILAALLGSLSTDTGGSKSGALAHDLVAAAGQQHLSAIAAKDPDASDRFVAALVFPDVQLLVVSAKYQAPSLLEQKIANKAYNDVYSELNQASDQSSRVFVHDMKADGIHLKPEASADILYEHVGNRTLFDGNPAGQKLSDAAYEAKFEAADALYSHMLTVLLDHLESETATR
jgi:hypothetical protein